MKVVKKIFTITLCLSMVFSLFFMKMPVSHAASYKAYVTGDAVALRNKATTKNSSIIDTANSGEEITVLDDTKIYDNDNDKCPDGWLKVSYNNQEGYMCSYYISNTKADSIDRPWNTPKKAIVGGAKFIGKAYIAKGQFTSYLKKFNVNPNGYYKVYSHLYQNNIQAPYSEAYISWRSYNNNKAMDLAFNFNIPVYENMSNDRYLNPTGKDKAALDFIYEVKDQSFEEKLSEFPDSYKPLLRELHDKHPSWTFTAMKTGLDFETAAQNFRVTGAINTDDKRLIELDGNGNGVATNEKGYYYPNMETMRYYLDPRNWLNETFVFMFENLSYSEVDENLIQGVLDRSTLINGYDIIDNQSYASIFKEAGKTANVNAVYLASLAVQEIGHQSLLVSGEKFTYEGKEYEGLFNFFNIGAYSSASNPVRAGLVYASGGYCTLCASYTSNNNQETSTNTNTQKQEEKVEVGNVANIGAKVSGSYVTGIALGTTVSSIQGKDTNLTYSTSGTISTGTTIKYKDGTTYTVVIKGDPSGDGKVNSADLLRIKQHLLGTYKLEGAYLEAANVNHNGKINSANLLKIKQYLLGMTKLD